MGRIVPSPQARTLLVPAMLDDHFPLLQYALYSKDLRPVILSNEEGITELGLKYVNNDMCYPCILNVGQLLAALASGEYPLSRTCLLMPTLGDACRGSNYISALRKAVKAAGFSQVPVLSMNVKGLERGHCVPIHLSMAWRALFAMYYGDILMLLCNQTRPYETVPGGAEALRQQWFQRLRQDLEAGSHLTLPQLRRNLRDIARSFSALPCTGGPKQRIGILGDVYTKYCHLGNWSVVPCLEGWGCEVYVGGLSWYVQYYLDSHRPERGPGRGAYQALGRLLLGLQREMLGALRQYGFHAGPDFAAMKEEAAPYVPMGITVGDGWLLGAEAVGMIRHGCPKVLAIHPFGCLPGHVCGKGYYPSLGRRLPEGKIVTVDVDASGSRVSFYNRVRMLVDVGLPGT